MLKLDLHKAVTRRDLLFYAVIMGVLRGFDPLIMAYVQQWAGM